MFLEVAAVALALACSFCFAVALLHHVGTVSMMKALTCFQAMACIF